MKKKYLKNLEKNIFTATNPNYFIQHSLQISLTTVNIKDG